MQHDSEIDLPVLKKEQAVLPSYASDGAAGADVRACIEEDIILEPGSSALIPTGLFFEIPSGYEIQVRPRSGLAKNFSVTVLNTPGTIDSDYRGELGVILINHGRNPFTVTPGMRIAQIVLAPVMKARFFCVEAVAETVRGAGGFGHTGLN